MIIDGYLPTDIVSPFPAGGIFFRLTTGSTMDDARALPADIGDGTVLWADQQLVGRGRGAGRVWHADPGANLLFTLVVAPATATPPDQPERIASIPLRVGLGVAETVMAIGVGPERVQIKWPNDVLIDGAKVCGVLCEGVSGRFHIGIGLNVNQLEFPSAGPFPPVSLRSVFDRELDRREVLPVLLRQVGLCLRASDWRDRVGARLFGDRVLLPPHTGGVIAGLGTDGELIVHTDTRQIRSVLQPDQVVYPMRG